MNRATFVLGPRGEYEPSQCQCNCTTEQVGISPEGPCGAILPITKATDEHHVGDYVLYLDSEDYPTNAERLEAITNWLENDVPDEIYNEPEKEHLMLATPYIFVECGQNRNLEVHIPKKDGYFVRYV